MISTTSRLPNGRGGGLLNIVVVGYGMAGRVHAKTHSSLVGSCRMAGIVEHDQRLHPLIAQQRPGVAIFATLEQALDAVSGALVLDFCVPAPQNHALAATAVGRGVNRFMLEKPLGWSLASAIDMAEILKGRTAVYLDTYLFSYGVKTLQEWVLREQSPIEKIHIRFDKNRTSESDLGRGFAMETAPDAWHIEGPHMVSIATSLAGDISAIYHARLEDMVLSQGTHRHHGSAEAIVEHAAGAQTKLCTDLCSGNNQRQVVVTLANQVILKLFLPTSKSTQFVSKLQKVVDGNVVEAISLEDRPLEQCVSQSLDAFLNANPSIPPLEHGIRINRILQRLTDASVMQSACDPLSALASSR